MNIEQRVYDCLEKNGIVILEDATFDNLDSINFISAIVDLESEFDIEFPDEYLSIELFSEFAQLVFTIKEMIS